MHFKQWLFLNEEIEFSGVKFRNTLAALQYIYANHPNPDNLVVSYTSINKIGINPKSPYDTPLGIYFYPLKYVIDTELNVPFAGDKPYINVCEFTRPNKILHMQKPTEPQLGIDLLNTTYTPDKVTDFINEIGELGLSYRSNYSTVWLVTYLLARKKAFPGRVTGALKWNVNLRKLGIEGFVDHGTGTIHISEPTQGVVFTANSLRVIKVIDNKTPQYEKNQHGGYTVRHTAPKKANIKKMSSEDKLKYLQSQGFRTSVIKDFMNQAPNKQEMANLLGSQIINKISNDDVYDLILNAFDKIEMATALGEENINKLYGDDVYRLLFHASGKQEMATALGEENINKLSDDNIIALIKHAPDNPEMVKALGSKNINKLHNYDVLLLFKYLIHDKPEIVKTMFEYIDIQTKFSYRDIKNLFLSASNKPEMAKIIDQYYTGKTPALQKIIEPYLTTKQSYLDDIADDFFDKLEKSKRIYK